MCILPAYMLSACGVQRRILDFLELELWMNFFNFKQWLIILDFLLQIQMRKITDILRDAFISYILSEMSECLLIFRQGVRVAML